MDFTGQEQFGVPRDELWSCLTDMEFMSGIIPDLDRIDRVERNELVCRVRPRFAFFSGTLKLTFEITEAVAPERLTVRSNGKGIGASVAVEAEINLSDEQDGTRLQWTGRIVERQGLLKPISESLIQGAAQKVIDDFWIRFRGAVEKT